MQYRAMMFSWAPLLVMGPGTVYRLYPPLGGPAATSISCNRGITLLSVYMFPVIWRFRRFR